MAGVTATSRRGYLSQDELAEYANITITDPTEADDVISKAEEIIDAYVGFSDAWGRGFHELVGKIASVASTTVFTLQLDHQNVYEINYFTYCEVEIIGGTGIGQKRRISSSTKEGVITVASAFATQPDATSFYKIKQLGKFPRHCDVTYYTTSVPYQYLKAIPEAVRRAVAAQIEYGINMGDKFFASDKSSKNSESIGDYSYSKGNGSSNGGALSNQIAPKAKLLLKGYINRVGSL